jgi:hypothetical protein
MPETVVVHGHDTLLEDVRRRHVAGVYHAIGAIPDIGSASYVDPTSLCP